MNKKNKIPVMELVTPQMKAIIEQQLAQAENFDTNASLEMMRLNYERERAFWNEDNEFVMQDIIDKAVSVDGNLLKTRVYIPRENIKKVVFFIHGGGWVVGSNNTHDRIMRGLAFFSKAIVIGIDYTLSPEAKFPKSIQECSKVIEYYLHNNFMDLTEYKVLLAGDSAGANMCVATYLLIKNKKIADINIDGLVLYYGVYGLKDSSTRSLLGGPWDGLSKEDLDFYYQMYLANINEADHNLVNVFNSDLTTLPPAFIISCELDPLKDDSYTLYEILKKNNKTKYKDYKGVIHGFLHYSKVLPEAMEALKDGSEFISSI